MRNNILIFLKEILTTIDYTIVINKVKKMNSKNTPILEVVYTIKINNN